MLRWQGQSVLTRLTLNNDGYLTATVATSEIKTHATNR